LLRGTVVGCVLGGTGFGGMLRAAPVTLRIGYGGAAEEPLWLLIAKPELGKNYGKLYTLDATRFQGSDKRAQAFEAGAIDLAAGGAIGVLFAAAEGVTAKIIASICRESSRGFSTSYYAKSDSTIKSVADLKGKIVGINGFSTSGHLWLKAALEKNGLSDTDVTITPVPFSAMQEALAADKIDLGMFPQPFAALLEKDAKVRKIFDAKYGLPFDEELDVIIGKDEFLKKNAVAIRAMLERSDAFLSRKTARGAPAPDRYQNGSGQFRRLFGDERLLPGLDIATGCRCASQDAAIPDQGGLPKQECRC
jgi:ABC-type nitrate/sulfonate/bicarbonate transport system substrate-binding protein